MKTVFTSSELPHIWAKQSQTEGRTTNRSMYFDGTEIYSYGRHFCMAKLFGNVAVITNRSYSNTTSRHLSDVRYSVNHLERVYIPFPEKSLSDNARQLISNIQDQLNVLNNSRKKQPAKNLAKGELSSIVHNIERFCKVTGESLTAKWYDKNLKKEFLLYLNAAKDEQAGKELTDKLQRLAESKKRAATRKQKISFINWIGDKSVKFDPDKVYLRAVNDEIQTSKGARVNLESGKRLFDRIQRNEDVRGHEIDHYTVVKLNGVLQVGCHTIERSEIERFAKSQGWI